MTKKYIYNIYHIIISTLKLFKFISEYLFSIRYTIIVSYIDHKCINIYFKVIYNIIGLVIISTIVFFFFMTLLIIRLKILRLTVYDMKEGVINGGVAGGIYCDR